MYGSTGRAQGHRPSRVPFALAVIFALLLGLLALLAASGSLDLGDARASTFGVVLRIVFAVDGVCCLAGAVLLLLSRPAGRVLTAVGGGVCLALPLLVFPAAVVAPQDSAFGVRQVGGVVLLLVVVLLGLLTMVQSLRRDTRDTIAHRARHGDPARGAVQ
ncbi:hypothetical protein CFN78_17875 [Amycolatopsis antarctica]|uniref:Uncharacterized protein n=1 Tax=Amycolatopsis antarctica TaxID=1854586 RepID=A0A263D0P5_9PSEU|nr:hypothetical protein [Amycolatopsis antarctica]OZM72003.1 hypothetical protein CFN78_17875 [Amycolatopsis antarctica]